MPAPANYILYKHIVFTIDGVEYANQSSRARLVPDTPIQTMRTLVPDGVIQDVDSAVWTLEIMGPQIWATGGLAKAMHDNHGEQIAFTLQLKAGTGQPQATGTIIGKSVPFGGDQGAILAFEETFPVVGAPTFGTSS